MSYQKVTRVTTPQKGWPQYPVPKALHRSKGYYGSSGRVNQLGLGRVARQALREEERKAAAIEGLKDPLLRKVSWTKLDATKSSNKKLLGTSASLLVTSALLVVTKRRSYNN